MGMVAFLKQHYERYFYEPQSIMLLFLVVGGVLLVWFVGDLLLPFLLAVVIAYVLDDFVGYLSKDGGRKKLSVVLVFFLFMALSTLVALVVAPVALSQTKALLEEIPDMMTKALSWVETVPNRYPEYISEQQIGELIENVRDGVLQLLQGSAVDIAGASVSFLFTSIIYAVIVPFTVFFLLYDKENMVAWFSRFLPRERVLLGRVWGDMDRQLSNYLRGKFYEVTILGVASIITFTYYDLKYPFLMAVLFGLSVIIPYVGAVVVTTMAIMIAVFQWGFTETTYIFSAVVLILQLLDGYLLVPLLFSRAVSLHPVAVILSIVFFGGIWGIWGVVLAIPLGTFIKVVIEAWPAPRDDDNEDTEDWGFHRGAGRKPHLTQASVGGADCSSG